MGEGKRCAFYVFDSYNEFSSNNKSYFIGEVSCQLERYILLYSNKLNMGI